MKFKVKWTPNWELISLFGKNKFVKSSYFWFILIPILAKALQKLKALLATDTMSNEWIKLIDSLLTLPFEWKSLYYSSVMFAIATILYAIFCPKLLQKFRDWRDFFDKGHGLDGLTYYYSAWLKGNPKIKDTFGNTKSHEDGIAEIVRDYCEPLSDVDLQDPPWRRISCIRVRQGCELKQVYWIMTRQMLRDKALIRWIIAILYGIGCSFLLHVICLNFLSVLAN